MKKLLIITLLFVGILTGCGNSNMIKPIKVTETDFNLSDAKVLMKQTWKPVNEMTNNKLETKPNTPISSREEFFDIYDFTYMNHRMKTNIFETIVDMEIINNEAKEVKDANGYLVFGEGNLINYIPTIYDEGVFIKKAYIRDSKYSEEHSYLDIVELVIEEDSNDKLVEIAAGFSRKNIFRKNEKGEWILYATEGTMSIGWER